MKHSYRRKVLLIAWSHFTGILKAKAFWMGVLMTPAIAVVMVMVMRFAENSQPTRHFAVIDNTGQYRQAIDESIAKNYVERALKDYASYFAKYKADDWLTSNAQRPETMQQSQQLLESYFNKAALNVEQQLKTAADMQALVEHSQLLLKADAPKYALPKQRFVLIDAPIEFQAEDVKSYVLGVKKVELNGHPQNIDAIAMIEAGASSGEQISAPRIQYWSTQLNDSTLSNLIENAVNQRLRQQLLVAGGIDMATLAHIENAKAELAQFDAKKEKGDEGRTLADRVSVAVPIFFSLTLFMVLMISVSILLQSIIEEKSNRLIEVLLSSVTPTQLMAGKLLGVASVSLVSIATWLGLAIAGAYFGFGVSGAAASGGSEAAMAASVSPEQVAAVLAAIGTAVKLLPVFIFCFICGYLIYASLFLAIGSLCSSPRDANTLVTPLITLMMVPIFLIRFFITDPNGTVATVFTWIPLYTPFAIVVRMSADPPLIEMIGSAFTMILMTAVTLWISARIFRRGVLYNGETPKLFQVFKLAFAKKHAI